MVVGIVAVAAAVVLLGFATIVTGVGEERLRIEAQAAFDSLVGDDASAQVGRVRVSFDGFRMLALDVGDARVEAKGQPGEIMHVGSIRFGLRFLPLVRGDVQIAGAKLVGARLDLAKVPLNPAGPGLPVFDDRGLVDPDAVLALVFGAAQRLFDTVGQREVDRVELVDLELLLPVAVKDTKVLTISHAVFERRHGDTLGVTAQLNLGDREATIEGEATRNADGTIRGLALRANSPAAQPQDDSDPAIGAVLVELAGRQANGVDRLNLSARIGESIVRTGRDSIPAAGAIDATMQAGTGKIEIDRLQVASGRSQWNFHGALGPAPASASQEQEPSYRFEMVSDTSTVAPEDSSESTLLVGARVAGHLDAAARTLTVDQIGVRSDEGEATGEAVVRFDGMTSPGVTLSVAVTDMPVGQAKQLWPWFAARSARTWALANVYGGRVESGRVDLAIAPGRMGDGVPLGPEEVSGTFTVRGTRFDVAGTIPPVRDGNGTITFSGTDVDIALDSGSVFLSGNRSVVGRGGTLAIRDTHIQPVVGTLRIDVSGTADAMLELAGHEPIGVGRYIDISPGDLSGEVKGVVNATIPFQREVAADRIDWKVELAYSGLALAKPFHGQVVTAAQGSIAIDPSKAVVDAKANLNGMPATVRLVEPLRLGDPSLRQRRVALQMDDKARDAIAPGLDMLLTGTTEVELDEAAQQKRAIKAKLDRATLNIPWVGWSKGSGVPAQVSFAMATTGDRTVLSDFRLSGDTFGATGALSLVGGALVSARFPSARLNRSDDFSVDVKAEGKGYAVTVRGKSIDARSVIKLYAKTATSKGGSGGGTPIQINLAVDAMRGFHEEVLRDVKFVYSGNGARTDLLQFSATTGSGKPVRLKDSREGGERAIAISSGDAGAVLRFLDIYERMQGGEIKLALNGSGKQPLSGSVDARDFWLVDEPRLRSIVSAPATDDGRSLNQTLRQRVDTQRVHFERGYSRIVKDENYLSLDRGILRGPTIGASFQGVLYDQQENMAMTGTFMPAYGVNRLFGEIPLIGRILCNGRDRGLIGITFRLAGKAAEPQLQVNPLSVIAPGIFRSVFEFR